MHNDKLYATQCNEFLLLLNTFHVRMKGIKTVKFCVGLNLIFFLVFHNKNNLNKLFLYFYTLGKNGLRKNIFLFELTPFAL